MSWMKINQNNKRVKFKLTKMKQRVKLMKVVIVKLVMNWFRIINTIKIKMNHKIRTIKYNFNRKFHLRKIKQKNM